MTTTTPTRAQLRFPKHKQRPILRDPRERKRLFRQRHRRRFLYPMPRTGRALSMAQTRRSPSPRPRRRFPTEEVRVQLLLRQRMGRAHVERHRHRLFSTTRTRTLLLLVRKEGDGERGMALGGGELCHRVGISIEDRRRRPPVLAHLCHRSRIRIAVVVVAIVVVVVVVVRPSKLEREPAEASERTLDVLLDPSSDARSSTSTHTTPICTTPPSPPLVWVVPFPPGRCTAHAARSRSQEGDRVVLVLVLLVLLVAEGRRRVVTTNVEHEMVTGNPLLLTGGESATLDRDRTRQPVLLLFIPFPVLLFQRQINPGRRPCPWHLWQLWQWLFTARRNGAVVGVVVFLLLTALDHTRLG